MPVRLFAGARSEHVSFNMLHRDDLVRVKQQLVCPAEDKPIERSDTVKGYEFRKGEYVVIEPEEIKKIEPRTAKAMEILEFVRAEEIDPVYFESSYYLLPEEAGRRPYALLQKAMEDSNFYGIAKLTMHNREYIVILRPKDGGIMLHTMYYKNEVREVEGFGKIDVELKPQELKIAYQLIEALSGDWEPEKYHDTFQENLKKLIEARLEGKEVVAVEKPQKMTPAVDLMAALKESLAQTAGKGKQPEQARAGKKPAARATVTGAEKPEREAVETGRVKRPKKSA
jgi:DNA end-binding protein Ku